MSKQIKTNTATRDPLTGILLFLFFGIGFFLAVVMPLFWIAGEALLTTTGNELGAMYKDIYLNHGIRVIEWFKGRSILIQLDSVGRLVGALFVAFYLTWKLARSFIVPKKTEVVEQGAAVIKVADDMLKMAKIKLNGADGIKFHPELCVPKSQEPEHFLVAGATGAGKSQVLSWMIDSILARGDKSIIFDIKGDYTAQLVSPDPKVRKEQKRYLVAPWDKRGIQWDIAADITNEDEAAAFASAFIPVSEGGNKYFPEAGGDVLEGVLCFLIETKGKDWGWKDLQTILKRRTRILEALNHIDHGAIEHIDGDGGQTQGVLGTIRTALKSIDRIAQYWPKPGGLPIVKRFMSDSQKSGTLIFSARPNQQKIAAPLIAGALSLMMSEGLTLDDDRDRRCWFICDELGALPKLSMLMDFITLARSKGLPMIAGTQDLGRLKTTYGQDDAMTIISQFGTQLLGRMNDKATATWAAELFGMQRVERLQVSENQAQASTGGLSNTPAVSTTWQQSDKAALLDSDFLHLNRACKDGYYFWCKLANAKGEALLGKLHFPINPVPKPFPSFIENPVGMKSSISSKAQPSTATQEQTKLAEKPVLETPALTSNDETQEETKQVEKPILEAADLLPEDDVEEHAIENEELDSLLDISAPEQEQEPEQGGEDNPMTTQIAGAALESVGLNGADIILDVAEALTDSGTTSNGATQQATTSKKKRKKLKSSLAEGL